MKNFFFSAILLLFYSCSKGPTGEPGKDGVANLKVYTFHISNEDWTYNAFNVFYYCDLYVYDITPEVLDSGTVEVFVGDGNGTSWSAIPRTAGLIWIDYSYHEEYAEVHVGNIFGANPGNPGEQEFKVVVIPPLQREANPDVNWDDYNDIAKHFKIQEVQIEN